MSSTKKPAAPAKKLKIGALVRFTRRNGETAEGRISGTDDLPNGRWVSVNTAPKGKNPDVTRVRPSELEFI